MLKLVPTNTGAVMDIICWLVFLVYIVNEHRNITWFADFSTTYSQI